MSEWDSVNVYPAGLGPCVAPALWLFGRLALALGVAAKWSGLR